MSLQAADAKKSEKRYTALEKAILAIGAAGLATALIAFPMLAQMFNLFSKIPALDIGYCVAEAEESVKPGPDAVGAGGAMGTDGKWHSLTSGKAYLPADVPGGVEDAYSALPPATGAAEEELDASENGTAHDNLAPR